MHKKLLAANIPVALLLALSLAALKVYNFYVFAAMAIFTAVLAIVLNYTALKKEDVSLRRYSRTKFQPEIQRIENAKKSLEARESFFMASGGKLKAQYQEACRQVEREEQEAYRFLASYDFVMEQEETDRMSEIAKKCERIVMDLNDEAEDEPQADGEKRDEDLSRHIREIRNLSSRVKERVLADTLADIINMLSELKNKEELEPYRRLFTYYLPTTENLLHTYLEIEDHSSKGQKMQETQKEITGSVTMIDHAIKAMIDNSYEYTALDAAAERSVLQTMMKQDHLS